MDWFEVSVLVPSSDGNHGHKCSACAEAVDLPNVWCKTMKQNCKELQKEIEKKCIELHRIAKGLVRRICLIERLIWFKRSSDYSIHPRPTSRCESRKTLILDQSPGQKARRDQSGFDKVESDKRKREVWYKKNARTVIRIFVQALSCQPSVALVL